MGLRREAREHALKMLYQAEIASLTGEETITTHWEQEPDVDAPTREFAERLTRAVLSDLEGIDGLLAEVSHNWSVTRMAALDRSVLRLGVAEMKLEPGTPAAVIIDEAIELARDYGATDSSAFVNGLLEAARARLGRPPREDAAGPKRPT